jgi:hypothetical protein
MENTFEAPGNPPPDNKVKEAASLPAILLMIAAAVGAAFALFILLATTEPALRAFEGMNLPQESRDQLATIRQQSAQARIPYILQLVLSAFVFFGALQMKNLTNYWLAVAGVAVGCIPCCGPCFGCFTLPLGVWALIVLLGNEDVKNAFR